MIELTLDSIRLWLEREKIKMERDMVELQVSLEALERWIQTLQGIKEALNLGSIKEIEELKKKLNK